MASHKDDSSCDEATSSLGDSTYDFIDDRSVITTDDEDQDMMTESTSSSTGHELGQHAVGATHSDPPQPANTVHSSPRDGESAGFSTSSGSSNDRHRQYGPGMSTDSSFTDTQEPIEFDEPSITTLNSSRFVEVSHILKSTDNQEIPNTLYKPGKVTVTVRQNMISRGLDLEGKAFKVLFTGDMGMKDPLVQKIGSALAAAPKSSMFDKERPRSSRFNVVPVSSFGGEGHPEVVLVDVSGIEMSVEECTGASFVRKDGGYDTINLKLSDGTAVESSWMQSKFAVSGDYMLPDLAIFCVPDKTDMQSRQTFAFTRSFTSRHFIPSIIVSKSRPKAMITETVNLDYLTPHICVEYQGVPDAKNQVMDRLPIDLNTFLSIDAGQMNRNLACLAVARRSHAQAQEATQEKRNDAYSPNPVFFNGLLDDAHTEAWEWIQDQCEWVQDQYRNADWSFVLTLSWLVFGTAFALMCLPRLFGGSATSSSRVIPSNIAMSSMPTQTSSMATNTIFVHTSSLTARTSTSSAPPLISSSEILSANTDITSLLLDAYGLAPNKSEQFKVHVVGDCHVVMRPPQWFSKLRNAPKLHFKITRKDSTPEHKVSTLFDGVYALQIPREEAYGILDVAIWTQSKPHIKEHFDVDFGSSWLKVAAWKQVASTIAHSVRTDLDQIQTSLSTVLNQTKNELSAMVQQAHALSEASVAELQSDLSEIGRARDLALAQTKEIASSLSNRFRRRRTSTPHKTSTYAKTLSSQVSLYARNTTAMISQRARVLSQNARAVDVKAFSRDIKDWRMKCLRNAQKNALKAWWKVKGLPKNNMSRVVGKEKRKGFRGRKVHAKRHEL